MKQLLIFLMVFTSLEVFSQNNLDNLETLFNPDFDVKIEQFNYLHLKQIKNIKGERINLYKVKFSRKSDYKKMIFAFEDSVLFGYVIIFKKQKDINYYVSQFGQYKEFRKETETFIWTSSNNYIRAIVHKKELNNLYFFIKENKEKEKNVAIFYLNEKSLEMKKN